jgi:NADPH:quinone reductase-like Zn-dependent oxidoreductase
MKAIVYTRFGPPEVLHLQDVPKPAPKAKDVLIHVHAATVCKEDPDMRSAPGFNGLLRPSHPILGQELAGEVEAVGPEVTRFRPGDQVFGIDAFGAYAEYKCMPESGALARMPAGLTYAEAASVPNGALTALPFLRDHGQIRRGQRVLVYGASGSVGTAAVQLARAYGAEVTGVCSSANVDLVKSLGASQVVDYAREDFTRLGRTYDIIFDAVGKLSFSGCRGALAKDGAYLTVVPTLDVLLSRRVRFAATGLRPPHRKAEDLRFITGLIESGQFRAVIDRCYPLEEAAEAHRYVEKGHKQGNIVIDIAAVQA